MGDAIKRLEDSFSDLERAVLRLKAERDALLEAAGAAHSLLYKLDKRDTPEALALRQAIAKAEGR